jgi:ComF family protein
MAPDRCPRCALPTPGARVCGECLSDPPAFERCIAAVDYAFPWDRLVGALKFRDALDLAGPLALRLAAAVTAGAAALPSLVLPVPLSPVRLRERGYNQAWELARRIGPALGVATRAQVLARRRDTPRQSGLSRERRIANLHGSFEVPAVERTRLRGVDVALVDDVMTTGATARAAARALREAGARSVQVWVAARTAASA